MGYKANPCRRAVLIKLIGIASRAIPRLTSPWHLLYSQQTLPRRLKFRNSFMARTNMLDQTVELCRIVRWRAALNEPYTEIKEELTLETTYRTLCGEL